MDTTILTIVGSAIGVLLAINAFFIKELVSKISKLELTMVKVTVQHDNTVTDVKDNKARVLELEKIQQDLRERIHSLEGGQAQLLEYIKETK